MKILFTAGDSFVGKAIRYLTNEPMSHVAIEVGDFVIHSTIYGPEIRTKAYFYTKYKLVDSLELPTSISPLKALNLATKYDNRFYDYFCLAWLGVRYVAKKYLKLPIPKVNLWQISGMYTCTEFASELLWGYEDSLITPYGLFLKLRKELNETSGQKT